MSLMYSLSLLVSSGLNAWSAGENRKSSEYIAKLNRDSSQDIARLSREHSEKLQYRQIKFSILQQRENQDFQRELAELNHERAKEIEQYRAEVNFAINQKNLDFQKWRFEQEKKIQYEILQLQQDFQRELSSLQHQNALEQMRERLRADKSPINNLACDLLENSFSNGVIPLKVLLSPPMLDYDPHTGKPYQAGYESFLSEEIRQFLHQGYLNSKQYPVQLLDKAWISNKQGGGSALQSLHSQLKSIPVLVLESETPLGSLNLRVGYWSGGNVPLTESTILSGQSFADLLYNSAKKRALEWQVTRQKLAELGKDEAYIKNMGGVHEENLQILYKELAEKAELEQHGIDISNLPITKEYKITDQDYKIFYQYLAVWHCLTIGIFADILFLSNSWENTPLLPTLLPYLLDKYKNHYLLTPEFWQEAISIIIKAYGEFYNSLELNFSRCLPEIRMKLALSLANLPHEYHYLALEQANEAASDWLRANDVPFDKIFDMDKDEDCQVLKRIIYQEDKPLLESLKQLLEKLKDAEAIDVSQAQKVNSLLLGWQNLNRWGNIPQLPSTMETAALPMIVEERLKHGLPNPSDNFTEILSGDVELEMIAIPAGDFILLGQKPTIVKLKGFWMSKYPITQAQYKAIMFYNPSCFRKEGDNRPVEQVTYDNAQEFCGKLSEKTGKSYQLPSEVQWCYASKAGSTTKYFFGDVDKELEEYAWFDQNSNGQTHPVGQKKPNPWGLYDIYGNVYEWCQDNWDERVRNLFVPASNPNPNIYIDYPSDGSAFIGYTNSFVLQGGSFSCNDLFFKNCFGTECTRDFFSIVSISIPDYDYDDYDYSQVYNNILCRSQDFFRQVGFRVVCVV